MKSSSLNNVKSIKSQIGTSLIEVLVSMIIIAMGLLGYAGLMAQSMKNNHTALMRSQATMLADDIIERMRVNRNKAITGSYGVAYGFTPTGSDITGTDLIEWNANLTDYLPAGQGSIVVDGTGNVTIQIRWKTGEKDENDADKYTTFTTQTAI